MGSSVKHRTVCVRFFPKGVVSGYRTYERKQSPPNCVTNKNGGLGWGLWAGDCGLGTVGWAGGWAGALLFLNEIDYIFEAEDNFICQTFKHDGFRG